MSADPASYVSRMPSMVSVDRATGVRSATVCSSNDPYPAAVTTIPPITARTWGCAGIANTRSTARPTPISQNGTDEGGKMVYASTGQISMR